MFLMKTVVRLNGSILNIVCQNGNLLAVVIGQDNKQVLLKYGSNVVRVHVCRLQKLNSTDHDQDVGNKIPLTSQTCEGDPVNNKMDTKETH